ncbi:Flp pilus assembly protein CpaB [Isoptericola variabilis]|uniref:SAF domain-containing protein n=1 Tax=Isoptericola variabilis (strain 225) TaxID=743718 RepID=F6FQU5_ISOV2|nr:Flp pilus assembly protein CpaB [Isoptericola variabilis]AEG42910.1 SAF domain-containing protein [Isoptericola variabilis 225]TWH31841.1 pilus assembly protein CpaB [Isoptericola variabilis J7]
MSRRIIATVLAALLAIVGGALTYVYASGADRRAMADLEPTTVLTVTEVVPAGTPAEEIGDRVEERELPAGAVVDGALTDLAVVEGRVATTDLLPGEQLLAERFVAPEEQSAIEIPPGFHQVSVQLPTQQVVGGRVQRGDTVGVFVSLSGEEKTTHLVFHKVLVTDVRGGVQPVEQDGDEAESEPAEAVMVTLALSPADTEKFVYAAQYESVWLSLEPDDAPEDGLRRVTPEVIFE